MSRNTKPPRKEKSRSSSIQDLMMMDHLKRTQGLENHPQYCRLLAKTPSERTFKLYKIAPRLVAFLDLAVAKSLQSTRTVTDDDDDDDDV